MNKVCRKFLIIPLSLALGLALARPCQGQMQAGLRKMSRLPDALKESSGLVVAGPNLIWSHEDSGNENVLYAFDSLGQLRRSITVANAPNNDWEDLAVDEDGNIYIADLGNNNNSRRDLAIYRIPNPENIPGNTVTAAIIHVEYADQTAYPPPATQRNFDVEALVWHNGYLYLFTKDRSSPFTGVTKYYKIPDQEGMHLVVPEDSFYAGPDSELDRITSADFNRFTKQLVLLTHNRLILFSNFPENRFFEGNITEYYFDFLPGQNEAIGFLSALKLYMTEEGSGNESGWLYSVKLPGGTGLNDFPEPGLGLYPSPAFDFITLSGETEGPLKVHIAGLHGGLWYTGICNTGDKIPVHDLPAGMYYLTVHKNNLRKTFRFVKARR